MPDRFRYLEQTKTPEQMGDEITIMLDSISGGRNIALLIAMGDGWLHTTGEIDEVYQQAAAVESGIQISSRGFANAQLGNSVAEVVTCVDEGDGSRHRPALFSLTAFGKERCLPLATEVARLCKENDISPLSLVGNRSSARTNDGLDTPFTRIGIYAYLLETAPEDPISIKDLSSISGLNSSTLHNHMPDLKKAGFINGISDGSRKKLPDYELLSDPSDLDSRLIEQYMSDNRWSERKRNLLRWVCAEYAGTEVGSKLSLHDIYESIKEEDKLDEFFRSNKKYKHNEAIQHVLDTLSEYKIFRSKEDPSQERTTHIEITEFGKRVIYRYLQIVYLTNMGQQNTPSVNEDIALQKAADLHLLNWLLRVDYEKGFATEHSSSEDRQKKLIEILGKGALSTNQIMEETGMKRRAAHNHLNALLLAGSVDKTQQGRESIWSLSGSSE